MSKTKIFKIVAMVIFIPSAMFAIGSLIYLNNLNSYWGNSVINNNVWLSPNNFNISKVIGEKIVEGLYIPADVWCIDGRAGPCISIQLKDNSILPVRLPIQENISYYLAENEVYKKITHDEFIVNCKNYSRVTIAYKVDVNFPDKKHISTVYLYNFEK